MVDIAKTIQPKSDQLNADDLITGPRTIKITGVALASGDQPIAINFEGDNGKPYKPCKTMRRMMALLWGSGGTLEGTVCIGRSMTLYRDPNVKWGGAPVGGIRISHMSNIKAEIVVSLAETKTVRKPHTVKPLNSSEQKQPEPEPAKAADPETVRAGENAAACGVAEYVKWRDALPEAERETIRPHNGEWSKKAKAVDAAKLATTSDDEIP